MAGNKMWAGRTAGATSKVADDFNSSIHIDSVMYRHDIKASMAHAAMLAECGIISDEDTDKIIAGLEGILSDIDSGALTISPDAEDIHMFVESVLTERIGDAGKAGDSLALLHVNSISQPWRSGSWRYFLRDSFPGGVADLEDPTHRGRQNHMDRSMLCRRGLVNLISQEHSWLLSRHLCACSYTRNVGAKGARFVPWGC